MNKALKRNRHEDILEYLSFFPVTAVLGPRQCGKSTLAKTIIKNHGNSLYLDLELGSDLNKLRDPEAFFRLNADKLICLDEIQRLPEIFSLIRSLVDISRKPGQFLLLGSASPQLLQQSSESLAGRIGYIELNPFNLTEIPRKELKKHWFRGGFPNSYLAPTDSLSNLWREQFIRTYLEKDIPSLGFNITTPVLEKLWTMISNLSGQLFNQSQLANNLGVSHTTIKTYLHILESTYTIRLLQPYLKNLQKRMIKSPKVILRDTGLLHSLLSINDLNSLMGHPVYGQSWESYAIEQICNEASSWKPFFYRTSNGGEIDLLLEKGNELKAIEFKASTTPSINKGTYHAIESLNINMLYLISPLSENESIPINDKVTNCSIDFFITNCL